MTGSDIIRESQSWPKHTCVAAFVEAAVFQLGYIPKSRRDYVTGLETRLGPNDPNPWQLPVEEVRHLRGVTSAQACRLLPRLLDQWHRGLFFRHIQFNSIVFQLYSNFAAECYSKGGIVGVGFDFAFFSKQLSPLRHVCRIDPDLDNCKVNLLDDSMGSPPTRTAASWEAVDTAVTNVDDGFWIIGPMNAMVSELAPRWIPS